MDRVVAEHVERTSGEYTTRRVGGLTEHRVYPRQRRVESATRPTEGRRRSEAGPATAPATTRATAPATAPATSTSTPKSTSKSKPKSGSTTDTTAPTRSGTLWRYLAVAVLVLAIVLRSDGEWWPKVAEYLEHVGSKLNLDLDLNLGDHVARGMHALGLQRARWAHWIRDWDWDWGHGLNPWQAPRDWHAWLSSVSLPSWELPSSLPSCLTSLSLPSSPSSLSWLSWRPVWLRCGLGRVTCISHWRSYLSSLVSENDVEIRALPASISSSLASVTSSLPAPSPALIIGTLGTLLVLLLSLLRSEILYQSLTPLPGLGIQLGTTRALTLAGHTLRVSEAKRFVPLTEIRSVVIHEALRRWNVVYYLGIVRDADVVVAFEDVRPRLEVLTAVYHHVKDTMEPKPKPKA